MTDPLSPTILFILLKVKKIALIILNHPPNRVRIIQSHKIFFSSVKFLFRKV